MSAGDRPRARHLDHPRPRDYRWPVTLSLVVLLTMVMVWLLLDRAAAPGCPLT